MGEVASFLLTAAYTGCHKRLLTEAEGMRTRLLTYSIAEQASCLATDFSIDAPDSNLVPTSAPP
jgi:hypothetical protein